MDIHRYWRAALAQRAPEMAAFFHEDAVIRWHNTNELFTVPEFIQANCQYPGQWAGEVERVEELGDPVITAAHVWSADRTVSCHATSFFRLQSGKIIALDEYWGDDGPPPQWRLDMGVGAPIPTRQE